MSKQSTCSVMMATYRPRDYLHEQVASIFEQQGVTIHLLISDDSEDKILLKSLLEDSCLQETAPHVGMVDIIDGPQLGLASANFFNLVLHNSVVADFYAFVDQDDIWFSDKLARSIQLLSKTESDCYSSELNVWSPPSPTSSSVISQRWRKKKDLFGHFFAESAGCTYLMSRTAFLSLKQRLLKIEGEKRLHLLFSHDLFTSAYLHSQGFKWCHDKSSRIYYRQHQLNAWGSNVMTFDGLWKRLSLLNSRHYSSLLYLAWMNSPPSSIASQLCRSLCRLDFRDRIFLFCSAFNAINLFSLKTAGLIFFILFTRKHQLTSFACD